MPRVALILEGHGDVMAGSSLIAKSAATFGVNIFASEPPIRAGNALKLKRPGELERYLHLALSREDIDGVLVLVDLDDGCAAEFYSEFVRRAQPISRESGKKIDICFCVREYEAWFLASIDVLRAELQDYGISPNLVFANHETIRDAKGALSRACEKKGYKQMRDQLLFTKKLDVKKLAQRDRSYRKLLKSILDKSYQEIHDLTQA